MKNFNLLIFMAVVGLLMGCDDKEIKLYPSFTQTAEAIIHHDGNYNEFADIYVTEIRNAIDDLDTDGGITDVMIEGIFLDVTKNAASGYTSNSASATTSNIILTGWDGNEYILIENLSINLNSETQEINLQNSLKKAGVKQLRDILLAIAQNNVPSSKEKVGIRLTGIPTPSNGYINAKMELRIKVVVEYSEEL
jgi:hypothetical protein